MAFSDLPGSDWRRRFHWWTWSALTGVLGLCGAVIAVLNGSAAGLVFAGLVGLAVAAAGSRALRRWVIRRRPVSAWSLAVVAVPGVIAIVGWGMLIQSQVLVLGLLVTILHPAVLGWITQAGGRLAPLPRTDPAPEASPAPSWQGRTPVRGAGREPGSPRSSSSIDATPAADLSTLSETKLCYGWRVSFLALQRAHHQQDMVAALRLIELRQHYLDEMERRNPSGFLRWLRGGARPASDPTRYMAADPGQHRPAGRPSPHPTTRHVSRREPKRS